MEEISSKKHASFQRGSSNRVVSAWGEFDVAYKSMRVFKKIFVPSGSFRYILISSFQCYNHLQPGPEIAEKKVTLNWQLHSEWHPVTPITCNGKDGAQRLVHLIIASGQKISRSIINAISTCHKWQMLSVVVVWCRMVVSTSFAQQLGSLANGSSSKGRPAMQFKMWIRSASMLAWQQSWTRIVGPAVLCFQN